jgi:hypothetical protein
LSSTRVISCGNRSAAPAPALLGPCAVIGEIEALLDEGVDIDDPVLARAFARMQQHVLDDAIGTFSVLHDFVEIAPQGRRQLVDLGASLFIERDAFQRVL